MPVVDVVPRDASAWCPAFSLRLMDDDGAGLPVTGCLNE
jgi:hypothetical protein